MQRQIERWAAFAGARATATGLPAPRPAKETMVAQIESSIRPLHKRPSLLEQSLDIVCLRCRACELDCVPSFNKVPQTLSLRLIETRCPRQVGQKLDAGPPNSSYSEMVFDEYAEDI